jgi:hypothetical protein
MEERGHGLYPVEGKRACRVRKVIEGSGLANEDRWPQIQGEMTDSMIRFEKALRPVVEKC